eukprot:m.136620 g.136620  ORF g.136620 m.136620 type:complete len:86 (+) comp38181_c0_seq6:143-400(+)
MGGRNSALSDRQPDGSNSAASFQTEEYFSRISEQFQLSQQEIFSMWTKYQQLNPDENRRVHSRVFSLSPFSDDWFLGGRKHPVGR